MLAQSREEKLKIIRESKREGLSEEEELVLDALADDDKFVIFHKDGKLAVKLAEHVARDN